MKHELEHRIRALFFLPVLMLLLCSCLSPLEYREIKSFDLAKPITLSSPEFNISVEPFINDSPCSQKMYYRLQGNRVIHDDYNRWVQNPAELVTRFVLLSFAQEEDLSDADVPTFTVSGRIVNFMIDLQEEQVVFVISYTISDAATCKPVMEDVGVFNLKYKKKEPADFAQTMSEAVGIFANRIRCDIYKLTGKSKAVDKAGSLPESGSDKKANQKQP